MGLHQKYANNAHIWIITALNLTESVISFPITGLDCDNGSEFMNRPVMHWAKEKNIYFTRSSPYKKNDQAIIESKNHHVVRKYAYHYRYDTKRKLELLNQLWHSLMI